MLPQLRAFLLGSLGLGAGCGSRLGDAALPADASASPAPLASQPNAVASAAVQSAQVSPPKVPVPTRVGVRAKQGAFEAVKLVDVEAVQGDALACGQAGCAETQVCDQGLCKLAAGATCRTSLDCGSNLLCVVPELQSPGTCVAVDACACGKALPKSASSPDGPSLLAVDPDGRESGPPPLAYVDTVCAFYSGETFSGPVMPGPRDTPAPPPGRPVSIQREALRCLPADGKPFSYDTRTGGNRCNAGDATHVKGEVRNGRWSLRTVIDFDPGPKHNCGRPLLVDGVAHIAGVGGSGWGVSSAADDSAARGAFDPAWAARMRAVAFAEHASIAAFARTTAQLCALGAPSWLVAATARALSDETEHAEGAFALARVFGDEAASPGEFPEAIAPMPEFAGLAEALLVDVIRGGCVGETLAVLEATELRDAAPEQARDYFTRVIADEARHAALAFQTVRWLVARMPALVPLAQRTFAQAIGCSGAADACRAMLADVARATVDGQLAS